MQKQIRIFEKVVGQLKQQPNIHSIAVIGSVAYGAAADDSDLDLLVLCDRDEFVSETIDGVWVETHFHQYDILQNRLNSTPTEVYKYLYSKTLHDDGSFARLVSIAKELYQNYRTPEKELANIRYWLSSTRSKLHSKRNQNDAVGMAYLLSTNTWKVLEGLYAINNRPMPPSSLAYHLRDTLCVAMEHWFEKMVMGEIPARVETMLGLIDLICQ